MIEINESEKKVGKQKSNYICADVSIARIYADERRVSVDWVSRVPIHEMKQNQNVFFPKQLM